MFYNQFIGGFCMETVFGALPDQTKFSTPKLSQVAALLILPHGTRLPSYWSIKYAVEAAIDNTNTSNGLGKWIAVKGEVPEPQEIITTLGKTEKIITRRAYILNAETPLCSDSTYAFLQQLQRNPKWFRFWYYTIGNRFFGGETGIQPRFVSASLPLGGGDGDVEAGKIRLEWFADGDAERAFVRGLMDGTTQNFIETPVDESGNWMVDENGNFPIA